MRRAPGLLLFAALAVAAGSRVAAAPPAPTQVEVAHLLEAIGKSGCKFYRNGSWYRPERAQDHLKTKYDYLVARDQIATTEDFIVKAATASSMSSLPYRISCAGKDVVSSSVWLHEELARFRRSARATPGP